MPNLGSHTCWWCGEQTTSMFWACERCRPLKEEGYRRAADRGLTDIAGVYACVFEVLREHGIRQPKDYA